jgi:hypothetical protein
MKYTVGIAIAGLVALWNVPDASAAACRNVQIHVHNDLLSAPPGDIELFDFDYYDYNSHKFREENFVGNENIADGDDYQFSRDLEYVDGESISIRIQFRLSTARVYYASSDVETCEDGTHYDVHVGLEDVAP